MGAVLPVPSSVTAAAFVRLHSTVAAGAEITATGRPVTFGPDRPLMVLVAFPSVCENGSNDTTPVAGSIVPVMGLALKRSMPV